MDTVGFNDRTWLDNTGRPHSDALRVEERYRRPERNRPEVQYVMEDSKALTKPYTLTRVFKPADREIQEYFCTTETSPLLSDGHSGVRVLQTLP